MSISDSVCVRLDWPDSSPAAFHHDSIRDLVSHEIEQWLNHKVCGFVRGPPLELRNRQSHRTLGDRNSGSMTDFQERRRVPICRLIPADSRRPTRPAVPLFTWID
ncbi:MAG: hypothetical protein ACK5Q5_17705 [Planctomycetaceae bacterium]